jgi:ribosome-binding protein aMBF1 (putative translation factor)
MTKLTHQILVALHLALACCTPHDPGDPVGQVNADNPTLVRVGAKIRAERERQGISQADLAAAAGLHRTYVGGVERGERNISIINLERIANALGVSVGQLTDQDAV